MTRRTAAAFAYSALYTYTLGGRNSHTLYIPLTSRCNTRTLPETRGPEFLLPPHVVASLLRIRDVEQHPPKWQHWCMYLETLEAPQKLPPALLEPIPSLPPNGVRLPSLDTLKQEINAFLVDKKNEEEEDEPVSLVFAGEGEPTLRWNDLLELANYYSKLNIRLTTNGLLPDSHHAVKLLQKNGVDSVSVAIMTADSSQYKELMKPVLFTKDSNKKEAHAMVCDFIQQAVTCQLQVEVTAVDRPDVDKCATRQLAADLGVTLPVRWRPYFPST